MANAFLEFLAVTRAAKVVNTITCEEILHNYLCGFEGILREKLEAANAVIYNNRTAEVLRGGDIYKCMTAYSSTSGFVELDEEETSRRGIITYKTPPSDPIVVTARCTKVMLDGRVLEMADTITRSCQEGETPVNWEVPKFTWINGVPGCGKTTWLVSRFDANEDVVVTTTTEAAKDLLEKLTRRIGKAAKSKVRTLASVLVNGFREPDKRRCNRLMVDEALMNHFGAIVMAARLAEAKEVLLIGDINQLPYIDRENLFPLFYYRPTQLTTISQNLLCTHRNPMDVAYALREVYDGIYSSVMCVNSLKRGMYKGVNIPKTLSETLYLVYTQDEKISLTNQGYGSGEGSRLLTIHEAQGLTYKRVIIVNTMDKKLQLHDSVAHAVVAMSRHTIECVYHADNSDGAIGRMLGGAIAAGKEKIWDHNLKMAMKNRDESVLGAMLGRCAKP